MSSSTCERCGALPPPITAGPWAGSRHELRYCVYCSKDLCDKCLMEGKCRETPKGDHRHRVEDDCAECDGATVNEFGDKCTACNGEGTVYSLVVGVRP
jgi:hypothetical protein